MEKGKLNKAALTFTVNKAAALPYGTVEAVIATEHLDRHNEHMNIDGIETPRSNYKAYYNHSYNGSTDLPVGIIEELRKSGKKLIGRIKLAVEEYPFAAQLYKMIQGGYVDSMSIGFIPKEWDDESQTWTKSEFIEASFVAEPANVMAMVSSKGLDQSDADAFVQLEKAFAKEVEKTDNKAKVKSITEDLNQLPISDIQTVLKNVKQSIRTVEELAKAGTPAETAEVEKHLIKLRVAAKQVDKDAEQLNRVIKVRLTKKAE